MQLVSDAGIEHMLKQLKEFLRLQWVSGLVLVATLLLLTWIYIERESAMDRDPGFTFDELLTTMAGVLTSIVVTTFSAVFVALQLASGQFSPRIVRGFFREDWRVQLVLALFVMVISYSLCLKFLGLTGLEDAFMLMGHKVNFAAIAIVAGIFLVLVVFPYFVYYIIRNINAAKIARNICDRTIHEIKAHFQDKWTFNDPEAYDPMLPGDLGGYHAVTAKRNGYLSHITPGILKLVKWTGHKVYITKFAGSFIPRGSVLAYVDYAGNQRSRKRMLDLIIRSGMKVHDYRSYTQDINFGIRQLVDIAIKAISPAVNDPTTAITCLNYLGDIVQEFAQYRVPSNNTCELRQQNIFVNEFSFEKLVDHAFNQIYFWGRADPIVVRHIVHVITEIIPHVRNPHHLAVLFKEVEDFELLDKDDQQLRETFVLKEHVRSLKINYLKKYVLVGQAAIAGTFESLAQMEDAERQQVEQRLQASIARLHGYREAFQKFLEQLANQADDV